MKSMLELLKTGGRQAAQQVVRTAAVQAQTAAYSGSWAQRIHKELHDYQEAAQTLVHVPTAAARTIGYHKNDEKKPLIGIKEVFYNCVGVYIKAENPAGEVKASLVHFHRLDDSVELLRESLKEFDGVPKEQVTVKLIRNMDCFRDPYAENARRLHTEAYDAVKLLLKEKGLTSSDECIGANKFGIKPDGKVFYYSPVKQWLGELTGAAAAAAPKAGGRG